MKIPAIGGAYAGITPYTDTQELINWYVEGDVHDPQGQRIAIPTPGTTLALTITGGGPIRGIHYWDGSSNFFVISGNTVWYVAADTLVATQITGTLNTSTGNVQMVDNAGGNQIMISDGTYAYVITWTGAGYSFAQIDLSGISGTPCGTLTYQDGYGIFSQPQTQHFWLTTNYDFTTYNPLYYASKEANPDLLASVISDSTKLFLFGNASMEIWFDSGSALFPFQRIPGVVYPVGCVAALSPNRIDNSIVWLGNKMGGENVYGVNQVFQCRGDDPPTVISNPQMDYQLAQYTTTNDAFSFVYSARGHEFYVLTFPTANVTWVWDATNHEWHQRARTTNNWNLSSICWIPEQAKHLVGDLSNGNIYTLDYSNLTDNGTAITRTLVTPHMNDGDDWLQLSKLQVVGNWGEVANGTVITLAWSQDYGHTFPSSYTFTTSTGTYQYLQRMLIRRLGRAVDWVFKITTTGNPILMYLDVDIRNRATGRAPGNQSQMFPYTTQQ